MLFYWVLAIWGNVCLTLQMIYNPYTKGCPSLTEGIPYMKSSPLLVVLKMRNHKKGEQGLGVAYQKFMH